MYEKVKAWTDAMEVRHGTIVAKAGDVDTSEKSGAANISEPKIRALLSRLRLVLDKG